MIDRAVDGSASGAVAADRSEEGFVRAGRRAPRERERESERERGAGALLLSVQCALRSKCTGGGEDCCRVRADAGDRSCMGLCKAVRLYFGISGIQSGVWRRIIPLFLFFTF